jgi:nitrite reductase (cytochrome c-552)
MKPDRSKLLLLGLGGAVAVATALVVALLLNITERQAEAEKPFTPLVQVTEDTLDPAQWGINWPKQYDSYKRTALHSQTTFGGHGGSEALPMQKSERDPWLTKIFQGYAFAIDYRDRRGHAYMLSDQEETKRLTKPQSGSCLHCHASIMPLYRKLGNGDAKAGLDATSKLTYQETHAMLKDAGGAHPVSCVDCHDSKTMKLRVTRPGFIDGIQELANSSAPVPFAPSIAQWRDGRREQPYDPNVDATRTEMRSFVCAQCHVEYYCGTKAPLDFPWSNGLRARDMEKTWNETKFPDGAQFFDFEHKESGAKVLKAQHPEFEMWSQGVHARSGVACADCHMPYMRDGAGKVSDHWVRSPLLNINRSCQTCHHQPEEEIKGRVEAIQTRNHELMQRAAAAVVELIDAISAAKAAGATPEQLKAAQELQRAAQWRLDFVAAENSMGFHAPQEAAMVLGEAADLARQGELAAVRWNLPAGAKPAVAGTAPAAPAAAPPAKAPAPAAKAALPVKPVATTAAAH